MTRVGIGGLHSWGAVCVEESSTQVQTAAVQTWCSEGKKHKKAQMSALRSCKVVYRWSCLGWVVKNE